MDQPAMMQHLGELVFHQSYLVSMAAILTIFSLVLRFLGC